MKRTSRSVLDSPLFGWGLFGSFLCANLLLSYFNFSTEARLWIGVTGLLIPLVLSRGMSPLSRSADSTLQSDLFRKIPWVVLAILGLAALGLRFSQLTTLSRWPLEDEAMNGYYAIALAQRGEWHMTYDFSGMPPLYVWSLGLFFKLFGVSLTSLWCLPSIFSFMAVVLFFIGARKFFSPSFALVLSALMAFGFWPLYAGRFSLQGGFLVFWECLVFCLLGFYWKAASGPSGNRFALALGVSAGLGFYTFTSWAIVAFLLTLFIFFTTAFKSRKGWKPFFCFFLPEIGLFLILAMILFSERSGHFRYVLQNPFGSSLAGFNDTLSIFWGSPFSTNLFAYRPFWGGFLNPLMGALCFWGAVVLSRSGLALWKQAVLYFVGVLPGFLTGGLDSHRVIQVMPLLMLASAAGLVSLTASLPRPWRPVFLGCVGLISLGLDSHHLFSVYKGLWDRPHNNWFASKSVERMRAYNLLVKVKGQSGPGYVLPDLVPDIFDQSLSVFTYPFNAAENPQSQPGPKSWAAFLVNVHFQPYLNSVFPEGKGFWLASDAGYPDGGLMLFMVPIPCSRPELLARWIRAGLAAHSLAGSVYDNHDWKPQRPIVQALQRLYPLFKGDPFLEACFWEKAAECDYHDRLLDTQLESLHQAVLRGAGTAHLYNNLGALYFRKGQYAQARSWYLKALSSVPNHTSAKAGLTLLDEVEKKGVKARD